MSILIQLIAETSELHNYTVQQLFLLIKDDITQPPLVQVALWCMGEYGEKLISGVCEEDEPVEVCSLLNLLDCILSLLFLFLNPPPDGIRRLKSFKITVAEKTARPR